MFIVSAFVTFFTIIDPVGLTTILYVDLATPHPLDLLAVATAILSALFAAWLVMRSSLGIIRLVGRTGIMVLSRILGILLAALALQFMLNGVIMFLHTSGLVR